MITKKEKATIQKYLGKHYSQKIIPVLNKKKIYNADGGEFSPASIQKIVNGLQPNHKVENQIGLLVAKAIKDQEKTKQLFKA